MNYFVNLATEAPLFLFCSLALQSQHMVSVTVARTVNKQTKTEKHVQQCARRRPL